MRKILALLTAAAVFGTASAAMAEDNFTYSETVKVKRQQAFEREFEWNDVDYKVKGHNDKLIFEFNDGKYTETHDITGYRVVDMEIGDINRDNQPELFVYLKAEKPNRALKLIGYSSNNGKSMSMVYLPEPEQDAKAYAGYYGFDEMAMVENSFCRRFPVIEKQDDQIYMNGMIRQLDYELVDGEACRILKIKRITEYPIMENK